MKEIKNHKRAQRISRHRRIRAKISGTQQTPRLAVFRSNSYIYAQLIDDVAGRTLAAADDMKGGKGNKTERAREVGKKIAEAAKKNQIESVVFDRGGFLYQGRIRALAEGAREGGLTF